MGKEPQGLSQEEGLGDFTGRIFSGVVGEGARLLWAEERVGGEDRAAAATHSFKK